MALTEEEKAKIIEEEKFRNKIRKNNFFDVTKADIIIFNVIFWGAMLIILVDELSES